MDLERMAAMISAHEHLLIALYDASDKAKALALFDQRHAETMQGLKDAPRATQHAHQEAYEILRLRLASGLSAR